MISSETITVGILAHVDAGKTTLAEALLYKTGVIRRAGRVDHRDAHLDTYALEQERGITIFSKQAQLPFGDLAVTLLDTPGHVDFSAEMERTLQVLDYALLVISGADGVQGHVLTLWRLLKRYNVPVFLFINKMDQPGTDRAALLAEVQRRLDGSCMAFCNDLTPGTKEKDAFLEDLATLDEDLMEKYLSGGTVSREEAAGLVRERKVFPCYFGSALRMDGVDELLRGMRLYMTPPSWPEDFSARVFRITREEKTRLTFLRVTGGRLRVKQLLDPERDEKADQIRIYSGSAYTLRDEVPAGTVCAVTGLTGTRAGDVLGRGRGEDELVPLLEPVMTVSLILPEGVDPHTAFQRLKTLEEEIPEMHLETGDSDPSIRMQIMGEVQTEILRVLIRERFGMDVSFSEGRIVYKETIGNIAEGVGHFEPLRHYAEVHLILEAAPRGSGITFSSACPVDELDLNWQRLIRTHVEERTHAGVLTGAPLTDVHITLAGGKAHLKHTQGGDFRQAVYRAIRQGLMQAENILLEPMYSFRLEIPSASLGRAMSDIQMMGGEVQIADMGTEAGAAAYGQAGAGTGDPDMTVLTGTAPVAGMRGYPLQVQGYTGGTGRIFLTFSGYAPCHNAEEVVSLAGYDPDADTGNPSGSVFCSHGAGMYVPWYQVREYMHLPGFLEDYLALYTDEQDSGYGDDESGRDGEDGDGGRSSSDRWAAAYREKSAPAVSEGELMKIFESTVSANSRGKGNSGRKKADGWKRARLLDAPSGLHKPRPRENRPPVLIVDGYNVIYDWDELRRLAADNLDAARASLMDILANYQGFRQMMLIIVFDAYKVPGGLGEAFDYQNIHIVYTKEAQTADAYIERFVREKASKFDVTVATSDAAQQMVVWGDGARRMSARELRDDIRFAAEQMKEFI